MDIFDLGPHVFAQIGLRKGLDTSSYKKHHIWKDFRPDCCSDSLHITIAGSHFLISTKQLCLDIEEEALAITWVLGQTELFTLGCHQFRVAMNHKLLVKVFSRMTLEEIPNMRLFWLKKRTLLPWYSQIIHFLGKTNFTIDAASHHPYPTLDKSDLSK